MSLPFFPRSLVTTTLGINCEEEEGAEQARIEKEGRRFEQRKNFVEEVEGDNNGGEKND